MSVYGKLVTNFSARAKRLLMKPTHQSGQYCQNQPFNKIGYIISNVIDIIVQVMEFLLVFFYPVCCS